RMLVRKLALGPGADRQPLLAQAAELLEDGEPDGVLTRSTFAEAVVAEFGGRGDAVKPLLARACLRSLTRDHAHAAPARATIKKLEQMDEGVLVTDLPALADATSPTLRTRASPVAFTFAAGDRGALEVTDAAYLPN